jgi:spore germination cell wall hydrolase CwlJ-like protein
MVASRKRPKGVRYYGPFGLSVLVMSLMPRQIGYQDLVALMARQPEASQRARAHMLASPFGTIHAATFSFPQPIGSLIPEPPPLQLQLAGVDTRDLDVTGALARERFGAPLHRPRLDFPSVNRRLKGDLLVARPHEEALPPADGTRDLTPGRVKTVSFPRPPEASASAPSDATAAIPAPKPEETTAPAKVGDETADKPASYALASLAPAEAQPPASASPLLDTIDEPSSAERLGRLYFGSRPSGDAVGTIQPWPMDEELLIQTPPGNDSDIKKSALTPTDDKSKASSTAGQTVAPKGEVTGPGKRPKTPAERLGLDKNQRARAEKCLSEAVYFESRGEPKRGQIAVAQVVMNRVFSGFYPTNVCGVVYQNANRKLACQFTFACDNVPDVVNEPDMWAQAKQIANDMLDGKLWLPEIGHSTHYHAYWVHPSWVNEMRRMYKIGVHSFYRPRAWGDGSDAPPLNQSQIKPQAQSGDAEKAKL